MSGSLNLVKLSCRHRRPRVVSGGDATATRRRHDDDTTTAVATASVTCLFENLYFTRMNISGSILSVCYSDSLYAHAAGLCDALNAAICWNNLKTQNVFKYLVFFQPWCLHIRKLTCHMGSHIVTCHPAGRGDIPGLQWAKYWMTS